MAKNPIIIVSITSTQTDSWCSRRSEDKSSWRRKIESNVKVANARDVKIMFVFLVALYAIMLSMTRNMPKVIAAI